jgi:hypothetical protein
MNLFIKCLLFAKPIPFLSFAIPSLVLAFSST